MTRISTTPGDLARRGFTEVTRSARAADQWAHLVEQRPVPGWEEGWLDHFDPVADPDLALSSWVELWQAEPVLMAQVAADPDWTRRTVAVLGGSEALAHHLTRHPAELAVLEPAPRRWTAQELRSDLFARCAVAPVAGRPDLFVARAEPGVRVDDELRLANRRHLIRIAAADLTHPDPIQIVDLIAAELADLADAVVATALAIANAATPGFDQARLAVLALGKCGAQELNYISDVDVLFVAEPATPQVSGADALAVATKVAAATTRICSAHSSAGSIWQLDAALRPEGKAGALVRTLSSMAAYYDKWAATWEFQAMLKARPMAGDLSLASQFVDLIQPKVWRAAEREHFMAQTQAMRQRVISLIPAGEVDREIKLSSGGLRDTEFSVQVLQLVHGRADDRVRLRGTLAALTALVDHGYIGRGDGAELASAYRFQRVLEHRVQLYRMRRTHLLPDDPVGLRRLGRGLGIRGGADQVVTQWRDSARTVRRLHQRIFYSPLLEAVAHLSSDALRLTPEAVDDRLRALGFSDPRTALRHIQALTTGHQRSAEIQRQLMPAMLGWFAEAPSPDAGLLAFRQVSESLGSTSWYLRALRDEGELAHRLAIILSSGRYAVDLLKRDPEGVRIMSDDAELMPRSREDLARQFAAMVARHRDPDEAGRAVRAIRRRELFRLAASDLLGTIDLAQIGQGLSDLTGATIDAALSIAAKSVTDPPALGMIALGRWGGAEMSFGSDADAMFVMGDSADPEATAKAQQLITRTRRLLSVAGPDPALEIDIDLRPEGKGGPMVRSVSSTLAYYERWADTWEAQALLRADHGAGDRDVTRAVLSGIDPLRYPQAGLNRTQLNQIKTLKARMETERLPRGAAAKRHLKLGPGGLSDIEWTIQVIQLEHAHAVPALRTTSTLAAIAAAVKHGLLDEDDARILSQSWVMASRLRNAALLTRGRGNDLMPTDVRELSAVAFIMGHGMGQASVVMDEQQKHIRRASQVVERLFWGREL